MNVPKSLIGLVFIWPMVAVAADFPIPGLQLNPAFHLNLTDLKLRADQGFVLTAKNEQVEVEIKGTPMKSETAAQQMAQVEMFNIKNLYSTRGSPYAGQISEVIACEKQFKPQSATVHVGGKTAEVLLAGVSQRKLFGACNHDQVEYWAAYFNFYDGAGARSISVKLFSQPARPSPASIPKINKSLSALALKLLGDAPR